MTMNIKSDPTITLIGPAQPGGVYLLWIALAKEQSLAFGRFRRGEQIHLPAGGYLYVGSAYGQRGAATIGYRLLRHATRTSSLPHSIRPRLLNTLQEKGLPAKLPTRKSLHWHIDYLLDLPEAKLQGVIAILTNQRMEAKMATALAKQPETLVLAIGLGASDHAGGTHLLHIPAGQAWWESLTRQIRDDGNLFL
jgi:Uri superfamily endonuclease